MADPAASQTTYDPTPGAADPMADAPGTDDQGTEQSKVLLTVLDNGDGTFTLVEGDEDEAASGTDVGAAPGGGGTQMGGGPEDGAPPGQSFDSIGALMKGILDCLQKHEAGADGSEDDNMTAGYSGADTGAPTMKQPPAMMRT